MTSLFSHHTVSFLPFHNQLTLELLKPGGLCQPLFCTAQAPRGPLAPIRGVSWWGHWPGVGVGSQVQSMPYNVNTVNKISFCVAVCYFSKIRNVSYMESEKNVYLFKFKVGTTFIFHLREPIVGIELQCYMCVCVCVCVCVCFQLHMTLCDFFKQEYLLE